MHHWLANWQLRAREATTLQRTVARVRSSRAWPRPTARSTTSPRCGGTAAVRCCASSSTPTPSSCSADRCRIRSSRCSTRGCASSRCARVWPTPSSAWRTPRPASGRPNARTRRAWKSTTPQPVSGTSWSTDRRCTATPRWDARSATPTSSHSAATCRSATGCGRRSPAIRAMPPTATSTPTTTSPASSRHGSPAATCPRMPRRRTTPSAPTMPSTGTSPTSSRWCGGGSPPRANASAGLRTWSRRSTPNCSATGGTRVRCGWTSVARAARGGRPGRHAVRRHRRRIHR